MNFKNLLFVSIILCSSVLQSSENKELDENILQETNVYKGTISIHKEHVYSRSWHYTLNCPDNYIKHLSKHHNENFGIVTQDNDNYPRYPSLQYTRPDEVSDKYYSISDYIESENHRIGRMFFRYLIMPQYVTNYIYKGGEVFIPVNITLYSNQLFQDTRCYLSLGVFSNNPTLQGDGTPQFKESGDTIELLMEFNDYRGDSINSKFILQLDDTFDDLEIYYDYFRYKKTPCCMKTKNCFTRLLQKFSKPKEQ